MLGRAKDVPQESAFSFHVALQSTVADIWIDGRHALTTSANPGATFLFDLSSNPVSEIHVPFDLLRFYISQASIDELASDRGLVGSVRLRDPQLGAYDRVLFGLATALVDKVEDASERSALFIDHIGLAFHAHVIDVYGNAVTTPKFVTGRLTTWQLQRVLDFLLAHLDGDQPLPNWDESVGFHPAISRERFATRRDSALING
ncbi:hypothetical protein [Bosea sp. TAB14]|uniref:hypothetical protein n=1 Tax=Bosea sp. TAB14 TaxID=3237481 RepID=UPI003F8E4F56